MVGDDFILTSEKSNKIFHRPTIKTASASVKAKLHHMLRDPACTVDMVPNLKHNSLMSARKFSDAQYITVLTPTEVLVYDYMGDLQLSISGEAILRGWRCKHSGLWQSATRTSCAQLKHRYHFFRSTESRACYHQGLQIPKLRTTSTRSPGMCGIFN